MNKCFIGFGHKARHGKNTAAEAIHCKYPQLTKVMAFTDALKAHCRVAYGMKEKDPSLLQLVGTNLYRRQNPNVWIDALYYAALEVAEPIILITDLRFPNEADFCRSTGGALIKVSRLNPTGTLYQSPDRDPNHESETALDTFDDWDDQIATVDTGTTRLAALDAFNKLLVRWDVPA